MPNRLRLARANRARYGNRVIVPQTAAGFARAHRNYMNMGVGIRRLAGVIIKNRMVAYHRRRR